MQTTLIDRIPKEYRYLALLMGLPLVDGVFLSVTLSGGLTSLLDSLLVGTLILGGGALATVIVSEFDGNPRQTVRRIILFGAVISIVAALQAMSAPTLETLLSYSRFHRGTVLALLILAIKMLPYERVDVLPRPGIVVLITFVLSIQPASFQVVTELNIETAGYALVSGVIATAVALTAFIFRQRLRHNLNHKILRYGCSAGLLAIVLSLVGFMPQIVPLGVFASSLAFANR